VKNEANDSTPTLIPSERTALAIWDRLPKVWPFQAKPFLEDHDPRELAFPFWTNIEPVLIPTPSRVSQ
jgi:hypothetical protein